MQNTPEAAVSESESDIDHTTDRTLAAAHTTVHTLAAAHTLHDHIVYVVRTLATAHTTARNLANVPRAPYQLRRAGDSTADFVHYKAAAVHCMPGVREAPTDSLL